MYLFSEEEDNPLEELVAMERRDGQVEKETIKNRSGNQLQLLNRQNGQTDEHVTQDPSDTSLTNADYSTNHANNDNYYMSMNQIAKTLRNTLRGCSVLHVQLWRILIIIIYNSFI